MASIYRRPPDSPGANFWIADEVQNRIRIRRGTTKGRRVGYDMPLHPQAASALHEYLSFRE